MNLGSYDRLSRNFGVGHNVQDVKFYTKVRNDLLTYLFTYFLD